MCIRDRFYGESSLDISQKWARKNIAYVPQESFLFRGSIRDNIALTNSEIGEEEIINAAKLANAHDFIMELPDGYDTMIGENGVKLSGGQRQRIAIARAMLKNAPILLLDEATSSLDTKSERAVQEALSNLMQKNWLLKLQKETKIPAVSSC